MSLRLRLVDGLTITIQPQPPGGKVSVSLGWELHRSSQ